MASRLTPFRRGPGDGAAKAVKPRTAAAAKAKGAFLIDHSFF
jgi:hypothetical protein